jgi:hypothetical protein
MTNLEHIRFGRKPGTARLSNRMNSVIWTINECIKERQPFPSLMLIYTSIDILGSLKTRDGFATRGSFKKWVKDYLFREGTFSFNQDDLYGARCGIVHTMRYDSRDNVTLKTIVYGFHGYDTDIRRIADSTQHAGVYIEELFDAFKKAYSRYIGDLEDSSDAIININLNKLPNYVDLIPLN